MSATDVYDSLQANGVKADDGVLLQLNQLLLNTVVTNNVDLYSKLCADDLTCIEPETDGHIIKGLDFHRFFFQEPSPNPPHVFMTNTYVKRLGDRAAMITYNRIQQVNNAQNHVNVITCSETRVWQLMEDGKWRCIHFHRS
jgi:calcium/calmodulin-dependent protein kinase (CaM kinase) II